jgi:hypothetical protein
MAALLAQTPCRRNDVGAGFESVKRYLVPEWPRSALR